MSLRRHGLLGKRACDVETLLTSWGRCLGLELATEILSIDSMSAADISVTFLYLYLHGILDTVCGIHVFCLGTSQAALRQLWLM